MCRPERKGEGGSMQLQSPAASLDTLQDVGADSVQDSIADVKFQFSSLEISVEE